MGSSKIGHTKSNRVNCNKVRGSKYVRPTFRWFRRAHEAAVPAPMNLRLAGRLIMVANSQRPWAKLQAKLTPPHHRVRLLTG